MSVRLIVGRAGTGKTHYCLNALRSALTESPLDAARRVLLTPEQAALQMERGLLASGPAKTLGRCEVLSFRRLAHRLLAESDGPRPDVLTDLGRQMLVRRLIVANRDALGVFRAVAGRPGFIEQVSAALVELIQHAVTPDALREAAASAAESGQPFAPMLADSAALYQAYVAELGTTLVDPEGALPLVERYISRAAWLADAVVYLDGFAGFTPQQIHFLAALARHASAVHIALLFDPGAAVIDDPDQPVDDLSLFKRTESTWRDIVAAMRAANVAVDPPVRLTEQHRFKSVEPLATLEQRVFSASPIELDDLATTRLAGDPLAEDRPIRLVRATDPRAEVDAVVYDLHWRTIACAAPLRFRDAAIVCRDLEPYHDLLTSALRQHGMPFFIDRRQPTHHHPLVDAARAAMRLLSAHRFGDAMIELLKTGLTPIATDDADLLENFVLARGHRTPAAWRDEAWTSPHDQEVDSRLTRIRAARARIVTGLADWWPDDAGRAARPGAQWAERLYALLERLIVTRRLGEWRAAALQRDDPRAARTHEQVWDDFVSLLEECTTALGGSDLAAEEFADVLDAGLANFTLGLVPPTLDQVLIGSIERSRHPSLRLVYLLGFNDGVFPHRPRENQIIDDRARAWLDEGDLRLAPSRRARLLDERMLAYVAATRAGDRLWISWPAADSEGRPLTPSPYLDHIGAVVRDPIIETTGDQSAGEIARDALTPARFAGALAESIQDKATGGSTPHDAVTARYAAARRDERAAPVLRRVLAGLRTTPVATLSADSVAALFPPPYKTSVSRLETFATCAFKHFAAHGLRLKERAESGPTMLDLGSLSHMILEHFFAGLIEQNRTLRDMNPDEIAASLEHVRGGILPDFMERIGADPDDAARIERDAARELDAAINAQRHWPDTHQPRGAEVVFGDITHDGDPPPDASRPIWPALEIETPGGRTIALRGKIDRIDLMRDGDRTLGMVLDYKRSRGVRVALDKVFHGLSLQLLSYLLVLREYGDRLGAGPVTPAAAFLLPLIGGFTSVPHPSDAATDPLAADKPLFPRGVIDFDSIDALDPNAKQLRGSKVYSIRIRTDGGISNYDSSDGLQPGELDLLLDHVRHRIGTLADRWLDGDVAVSPAYHQRRLPCGYCPFGSVCRFEVNRMTVTSLDAMTRGQVIDVITGARP